MQTQVCLRLYTQLGTVHSNSLQGDSYTSYLWVEVELMSTTQQATLYIIVRCFNFLDLSPIMNYEKM